MTHEATFLSMGILSIDVHVCIGVLEDEQADALSDELNETHPLSQPNNAPRTSSKTTYFMAVGPPTSRNPAWRNVAH